MRCLAVLHGMKCMRISEMSDEAMERLRLRIRLTEMMLQKRERDYDEAKKSGTELQRMMRFNKLKETANELLRLKRIQERIDEDEQP